MDDGRRVRGLAVPQCGLEPNLFGSVDCRIIQTVPETLNDSNYVQLSRCFEYDFQQALAFDSFGAALIGGEGNRFGQDHRGYNSCNRLCRTRLHRRRSGNVSAAEARLSDWVG